MIPRAASTSGICEGVLATAATQPRKMLRNIIRNSLPEVENFLFSLLPRPFHPAFIASFDALTPDVIAYDKSEFKSRFRHFSCFRWSGENYYEDATVLSLFNGERPFHTFHAQTQPTPMAKDIVDSGIVSDLLYDVTQPLPLDRTQYFIGVNQIRVIADKDHTGSPAPGLHQDGYDYSAHLNVKRKNVKGGRSLISTSPDSSDMLLEHYLQPGQYLFFNDKTLYHTATAVECDDPSEESYRDMVIIDFVRAE